MRLRLHRHYWDAASQAWLEPGAVLEVHASDLQRLAHHGEVIDDTADDPAPSSKPGATPRKK